LIPFLFFLFYPFASSHYGMSYGIPIILPLVLPVNIRSMFKLTDACPGKIGVLKMRDSCRITTGE
ncbi:MAG: hypothetical protein KAV87_47765, partial [Desulfobacteraceae bacterium]|nr:hypothetical protein [Desulfobacteraceae bacterium]